MEEMNRITIILSFPDSRLMPNRKNGKSWTATQDVKTRAKREGYFAALAAAKDWHGQIDGYVHLRVTFVASDNRHRDLDNLLASIKPQLDGISKALGIDDKWFRPITIDAKVDIHKRGFVIVEVG